MNTADLCFQCGHDKKTHTKPETACADIVGNPEEISAECRCRRFVDWKSLVHRYERKKRKLEQGIRSLAHRHGQLIDEGKTEEAAETVKHLLAASVSYFAATKELKTLYGLRPYEKVA